MKNQNNLNVTCASGISVFMMSATICSCSAFTGEKIPETTILYNFFSFNTLHSATTCSGFTDVISILLFCYHRNFIKITSSIHFVSTVNAGIIAMDNIIEINRNVYERRDAKTCRTAQTNYRNLL